VGDPQQLPATVLSSKAQRHHLAQSLFERLQRVRGHACSAPLPSQSTSSISMHVHVRVAKLMGSSWLRRRSILWRC
jgi:hypothetical protein